MKTKLIGLKEKKGDIPDMIVWIIYIFVFAIGFFILAYIIPLIGNGLSDNNINNSAEGRAAITSMNEIGTVTIQRGFFFLFVGLCISVMITSFLSRAHPMFLFLYIIFLAITIILGAYLGNAYEQLTNIPIFATTLQSQSLINLVMNNLLKIALGVGALSFIIVFSKFRTGGDSSVI